MAAKPKKVAQPQPLYTATLKSFGRTYTSSGPTIVDAIGSLQPPIAKGKGILTVTGQGKTYERILMPVVVMRLFGTRGLSRDIVLKQISKLFA